MSITIAFARALTERPRCCTRLTRFNTILRENADDLANAGINP